MTRENVDTKARRYLSEGRLTITHLDSLSIEASCRGGGAVYELGHNGEAWWCDCPARGLCAHVFALQAVTVRAGDEPDDPEEPTLARSSGAAIEVDDPEPQLGL